MKRQRLSNLAKGTFVLAGAVCLGFAVSGLDRSILSIGFFAIVVFSTLLAPRMSLTLPRSNFAISFSDASIFLVFLMYGGPAAILVAALESASNCLHLRKGGFFFGRWMIPTNISINVISIAATYLIWLNVPRAWFITPDERSTQHLVATLGSLAIAHFLISSVLVSILVSVKNGRNFWQTWKDDCFSSSMTQIVGAGLAALVYKLINFNDVVTGFIAFGALGIAYLSYRQSLRELGDAMAQTEAAEREKAETERQRRLEAEEYANQLAQTLTKEERANEALRKSEKDLQHAALHDALTNLANRTKFSIELRALIDRYRDDPKATFQVLFLDIQKFKHINDSLGHTLGDKVLMIAAKRFVRMLNHSDLVARIGGDEFAIILKNLDTVGKAQKVARRIRDSISQPFSLSGNRISITVNIGIAPCDAEYVSPEEILRDADIAMHYAKEKESGTAVFTKELRIRFLERVRLENDLSNAIERNELSMNYQPLIDLQDGSLWGFEALLRWHHGEFGQIPPNKFIPIAEESGLIIPMTNWILEETCKQLAKWQRISPEHAGMIMSVNISGKHLSNDDLIDDVENALAVSGIDPSTLKLEITESAAMENAEHTISVLNRLKATGVQLSIDDFGTGYSSLSYLHRLPFDTLKIDRSFVYSVGEKGEDSEILQTIISLAKNLKKKVIAEGIETESQLRLLQNLGCDYGQGYLMSRPQTKDAAERALYERRSWLPTPLIPGISDPRPQERGEESLPVF
ncbi:MAG: EAL domain-containing protein [Acidobacteria bacterium]|nr:EAL domain-containing protein [Acidobacteriota bacterium]MBP7474697.1 EAL domain-containing protein [Pyrinomonadaceae bacterium]